MLRTFMLIAAIGGAAGAYAADAYRWVDANGVVHFSDTEPAPELKAQKVRVSGAKAAQATEPAAADDQKSVDAKPAPTTTLVAAADKQESEARCQQARSSLELLQSKHPVGLDDGSGGKPVALDDKARQQQIGSLQVVIGTYCK